MAVPHPTALGPTPGLWATPLMCCLGVVLLLDNT